MVFLKVYPIQKMKGCGLLKGFSNSRNEGGDDGGGLFEGLYN